MKWLFVFGLLALLLGPLRRWLGRHWALLVSVLFGALVGWVWGSFITMKLGPQNPLIPLVCAIALAIMCGRSGPKWFRRIERDGKNGNSSRGH